MSDVGENLKKISNQLTGKSCTLVAVSKTKSPEMILEAYHAGQRDFGENKVQELTQKHEKLPMDIRWHMIGHLQRNKVKYIAPFVHLIHSVDTEKLLREINKQGEINHRQINCLLQVHIARERTKFGFSPSEIIQLLNGPSLSELKNVKIIGLMGMATFTEDESQIRTEFLSLKSLFDTISTTYASDNIDLRELSMGMSGDYLIAIDCGSTMIRVGSLLFGDRVY